MNRFSIVLVNLDPTIGHEVKKTRPCVILSPDEMNNVLKTIIVAPITSTNSAIPTRILIQSTSESGLSNDRYAMLDQIKTIDKSRVIKEFGTVSEGEKRELVACLQELFSL